MHNWVKKHVKQIRKRLEGKLEKVEEGRERVGRKGRLEKWVL